MHLRIKPLLKHGWAVLFFDRRCALCNAASAFAARRSPRERLGFCAIQSEAGQASLEPLGLPPVDCGSLVLLEDDRIFTRSEAVIRLARHLVFPWPLIADLLSLLPRFLLDGVYLLIARNRHRLFGRLERDAEPDPALSRRYIA